MPRILPLVLACLALCVPIAGAQDREPDWSKKMDVNEYWGWMEGCVLQGEPKGYDLLVKLSEKYKDDGYANQVFEAVWTRLLAQEEALKRDPTDDVKANITRLSGQLVMLGKVIKQVHASGEQSTRIADFARLDPEQRKLRAWARERVEAAKGAMHEKDWKSAIGRIDAGIEVLRKQDDKDGVMRACLLRGECSLKLKETANAKKDLDEALALAKELGDADRKGEAEKLLAEVVDLAKTTGASLRTSALDKPESWDTKEGKAGWVEYPMIPGRGEKLPLRTPSVLLRNHSFFWRIITLEDGKPGVGGVAGAEKLPFPGDNWLVKLPGDTDVVLCTDPTKPEKGTKFKVGPSPEIQTLKAVYANPQPKPGAPTMVEHPYAFEVTVPLLIQCFGGKRPVGPSKTKIDLRIRGLSWRTGVGPGKQPFHLVDGNFNGLFGTNWSVTAGMEKNCDIGNDGFHIGGGRMGGYFSPLVRIGKDYYLVDPKKTSLACEFRKFTAPAEMAKFQYKYTGKGKVAWLMISTSFKFKRDNRDEQVTAIIDVTDAKGPIDIPSGGWSLHYGMIADGDDEESSSRAEIERGSFPSFEVEPGKTHVMEFGGPFTPDIKIAEEAANKHVVIYPLTFRVQGAHGEIYRDLYPEPFEYDWELKDAQGRSMEKGSARRLGERDQMPLWEMLGYAKTPPPVPLKPGFTGPFWLAFSGQSKLFGTLAVTRPPAPPPAEKPAEKPADKPAEGGKH